MGWEGSGRWESDDGSQAQDGRVGREEVGGSPACLPYGVVVALHSGKSRRPGPCPIHARIIGTAPTYRPRKPQDNYKAHYRTLFRDRKRGPCRSDWTCFGPGFGAD